MEAASCIPLLAIGNSHLWALQAAWEHRGWRSEQDGLDCRFIEVNTAPYFPAIEDNRLKPEIAALLAEADLRLVVSMVGGNENNVLGLINHHPTRFDFVLPEAPDLPLQPDADIVPYELVRLRMRKRLHWTFQLMTLIRQATTLPAVHLESPPPIPCEDFIRENPDAFADAIRQYGVSPVALRYKLWRLQSSLFQETCRAVKFRFVPAPRAMQDDQGMLVREGWWRDPTHANHLYGERLYRQVLAIVERRFASDPQSPTEA